MTAPTNRVAVDGFVDCRGADRTMPQMTKAQKSYLTGVALGFMMSTTLWVGALYYFKVLP